MKRIFVLLACLISLPAFATDPDSSCGLALPTDSPGFCRSFETIAKCHCAEKLPAAMCNSMSMTTLYNHMIAIYRTQERACQMQHDTTYQDCMNDWNCFRLGGRDSTGKLCSSTGAHC